MLDTIMAHREAELLDEMEVEFENIDEWNSQVVGPDVSFGLIIMEMMKMEDLLDMIAREIWRLFKVWIIKQWQNKAWIQVVIIAGMILSLGIAIVALQRGGEM